MLVNIHAYRKYIIYTYMRAYVCVYNYRAARSVYRQLHRRFYFPSVTPQLRVSQPQNVSSPSLSSPVKLDFIGLLSILRSPKVLLVEAITADRLPRAAYQSKIRLRSDRSGAVCIEKQSRSFLPIVSGFG